ncbi:hypothetical protein GCM10027418_18910 [Mariniluteicoccus endophyticus]
MGLPHLEERHVDWPNWMGDLPTWITTLAVVVAAGQFLTDRNRRQAERDREAKAQASRLTAWAVTDPDPEHRRYGVMLSNTSGSTFHDVEVRVRMHGAETERPLRLNILPPGSFCALLNPPGSPFVWDFADSPECHHGHLRPYMKSDKYQILAVCFTDNLGQRWATDHRAVLTLLRG